MHVLLKKCSLKKANAVVGRQPYRIYKPDLKEVVTALERGERLGKIDGVPVLLIAEGVLEVRSPLPLTKTLHAMPSIRYRSFFEKILTKE